MNHEIIYSDRDVIVINKPPGVAVHSSRMFMREASGGLRATGNTLVDFLLEKFPEIKTVGDDPTIRPGIVHRLDKDTSGILVIARNQKSFEGIKKLFQQRRVEKIYRAIVCGSLKTKRGVIAFPIGRIVKNPLKRGIEKGKARIRGAREAITEYRVLRAGNAYSLVELRPRTGRMHQLRVHMKELGHPIACDRVYGGKGVCCPLGVLRHLLHAQSLSFVFPERTKRMFEADPPDDFLLAEKSIL